MEWNDEICSGWLVSVVLFTADTEYAIAKNQQRGVNRSAAVDCRSYKQTESCRPGGLVLSLRACVLVCLIGQSSGSPCALWLQVAWVVGLFRLSTLCCGV